MSIAMHRLTVPNRPQLLEALGHLAIAHTHLERILRYTVNTLPGTQGLKVSIRQEESPSLSYEEGQETV